MDFIIDKIGYGWFDVSFLIGDNRVTVTASYAWGHDSPQLFLMMLYNSLCEDDYENSFVIWDEEPGEYFVCLEKEHETYRLSIGFSEDAEDLYGRFFKTPYGDMSYDKVKSLFPDWKELLSNEINITDFAKSVCSAFEAYNADDYEKNWTMPYPKEQIELLKNVIKNG